MSNEIKVTVIMGSISDDKVVQLTCSLLEEFEISYEKKILSAHRTLDETLEYVRNLSDRGVKVVIAAAGGAAHLAGVIAGACPLPVIGIPMETSTMGGLDSLLSIVQMPAGVPVATVAIGKAGAKNAAILAATMMGSYEPALKEKIVVYKETMKNSVLANNE